MTARPTFLQSEALVQFMEVNPGIAKGHVHSAQGKWAAKKKWEEIATSLNSMGGASKDAKGWIKYWTNKKFYLKRTVGQRNMSARKTDGGVDVVPQLDPLEERMLSLLGGDAFATGNPEIRAPFNIPLISEEPSEETTQRQSEAMFSIESVYSQPPVAGLVSSSKPTEVFVCSIAEDPLQEKNIKNEALDQCFEDLENTSKNLEDAADISSQQKSFGDTNINEKITAPSAGYVQKNTVERLEGIKKRQEERNEEYHRLKMELLQRQIDYQEQMKAMKIKNEEEMHKIKVDAAINDSEFKKKLSHYLLEAARLEYEAAILKHGKSESL